MVHKTSIIHFIDARKSISDSKGDFKAFVGEGSGCEWFELVWEAVWERLCGYDRAALARVDGLVGNGCLFRGIGIEENDEGH